MTPEQQAILDRVDDYCQRNNLMDCDAEFFREIILSLIDSQGESEPRIPTRLQQPCEACSHDKMVHEDWRGACKQRGISDNLSCLCGMFKPILPRWSVEHPDREREYWQKLGKGDKS